MNSPASLIAGRDASGIVRPVAVTSDGKLDVGLAFSGTVSIGTVSIDQTTAGTTNGVVVKSSTLPTGAATETTSAAILAKIIAAPATEAAQTTQTTRLTSIDTKVTACNTGAVVVSSSSLPSGAATAAKQPALGTAGTPSADVLTVQGSPSGTPLPVTPSAVLLGNSTAYESGRVFKNSAGTLYSISGYNSGPAQFIHLFNSATIPADGAVPVMVLAVPAQTTFSFNAGLVGIPLSAGIAVTNSTTGPTKTLGSANLHMTALFV
jgi:hypothetical protein